MENNQLAFDVAEREFGIPPVTTGKEMASAQEPDKLSMVMYLSKFYELFRGAPLRPVGKGLLLDEAFPAPEPSLLRTYSLLPFTLMASVLGLTLVPPLPLSLNRGRPCAWVYSPGEGNGNPFQYSHREIPQMGGAWQITVHGVAKSRAQLSD